MCKINLQILDFRKIENYMCNKIKNAEAEKRYE
jgi:hypothetical protein